MAVRKKKIKLNWLETIEEAVEKVQGTDKKIMLFFTGSDWCPWCIGLYEYGMNNKTYADYAEENLAPVFLDFPHKVEVSPERKKYCKDAFDKYQVTGLPMVVLLDKELNQLGFTGYRDGCNGENFVQDLKDVINGIKRNDD